ncbi:2-polyprenyl-6-methoxyphenol hydroxylase [Kitasatospora xanthocidica]|uniref:FAD binding domain-containing protein n=1 Tax=Kitasatospora xanthocidica TaxID=83382 RepID=UPI0016791358|nr:FAD-dependent monooxygenase [Kitasatospora xanthocidica]GHF35565.1 2-polyprenyl-6-methoxyphenol hydroxylase [Kitasatospora xanthocidica]
MRGGSVAVVGGSIAGSAFAGAAARLGAERVVVLERSPGRLEDRGVGICTHNDRFDELVRAGHLAADTRRHRLTVRRWVTRGPAGEGDGPDGRGRLLWDQPFPFHSHHWAVLWQALRERTPARVEYRLGTTVTAVGNDGDDGNDGGAWTEDADGGREPYDLVIGADGYRSVVRAAVCPQAAPEYAGYVCWRGSYDTALLDELPGGAAAWPEEECITACYRGGQVVIYRIPGLEPGRTQVNWVFYAPTPAWLHPDGATSVPAGALTEGRLDELRQLAERHLPPYWAGVVTLTPRERTLLQPVYDLVAPHRTAGRLLIGGDAATVVRPHNTSGAVKALQDAHAFERAGTGAAGSWSALLAAYDRERSAAGRELVDLGRTLGRAQVTEAPDWSAMDGPAMAAWWQHQLTGSGGFGGHALGRTEPSS